MKLTFFSDTHQLHEKLKFTGGDTLVFCGDLTKKGSLADVKSFSTFVAKLDYKNKIIISGNHDFCFENEERIEAEGILKEHELIYLNDSGIVLDGINFWGSPIQPWFHNWAFNRHRGEEIKKHWDLIPNNTDVLITHGPPLGILDLCFHGERVGCEDLLNTVSQIQPRIHAFGHIHEEYGTVKINNTVYINACSTDETYSSLNLPIDIHL